MRRNHSSERVTVGLIGAGEVAAEHFRAFQALNPLVEIIGVADVRLERAQALAKDCGATAYRDYQDLLSHSPDIAVVCLPHHLHYKAGLNAAAAGCHILMEKPLASTLEEAREILSVCKRYGVKLSTGFVHRYRAEYQEAARLIRSGEIGEPRMIVEHFGLRGGDYVPNWVWQKEQGGGGVMMYTGIHMIDRLRWLLKSEVKELTAKRVQYRNEIDVEEGITATLEFENGCMATLIGNQPNYMVTPITKETEIYGSRARLRIRSGEYLEYSDDRHAYKHKVTRSDHFLAQARNFTNSIVKQEQPWITGEDGLKALEVTLAIYLAISSGRSVEMQEIANSHN